MNNVTRLGVDWGNKTIGLSLGLPGQKSMPLLGIEKEKSLTSIIEIIQDYVVQEIIVGLPDGLNRDKVIEWAKNIEVKTQLKVFFIDEFASTNNARREWYASNRTMRSLNKKEHGLAACEILDRYTRQVETANLE